MALYSGMEFHCFLTLSAKVNGKTTMLSRRAESIPSVDEGCLPGNTGGNYKSTTVVSNEGTRLRCQHRLDCGSKGSDYFGSAFEEMTSEEEHLGLGYDCYGICPC